MTNNLEVLQAEVLRLSPADRAKLLNHLINSLGIDDAEADAAWDSLADAREQELESGTQEAIPIEVAVARLEARFPG
ncbi:MAG: addiction module protein [Methylobacillus sp.]|jgi:putative addiction module component (TIGR02574 family)|nr:addiction module protein [Methylobacillus sp.]